MTDEAGNGQAGVMPRVVVVLGAAVLAAAFATVGEQTISPARYRSGGVPPQPPLALGGGEVLLEVGVDSSGRVANIRPLRTTPPFTKLVVNEVRRWRFHPALLELPTGPRPVNASVLVAALFRPPALLGPTPGEPPRWMAEPPPSIPFPLSMALPAYPPDARSSGVVLLEVLVERDGSIGGAATVRPAPPFEGAALAALRKWRFRPALVDGEPVATYVYVMFGFREPVSSGGGE